MSGADNSLITLPPARADPGTGNILFSAGSVSRMSCMVAHDKDADLPAHLPEKKIVWEAFEIAPFESACPAPESLWVLRSFGNAVAKLLIKLLGKFHIGDVLVIAHDRLNLEQDARVEGDVQCLFLPTICRSNSARDNAIEGSASNSASRRRASASP